VSENRKEILDAIMRAMEIEKDTFDFYTAAEQKTFDQGGKRIFHWLAKTEETHYLKLSELYSAMEESGRWVFLRRLHHLPGGRCPWRVARRFFNR